MKLIVQVNSPASLSPQKNPWYLLDMNWVGLRASLDAFETEKYLAPTDEGETNKIKK